MPAISNKQGERNLSEKWSARTYQSEVMADPKAPRAHIPTGPQANAPKASPASLRMSDSLWACVGSPNPSRRNKHLPRMIRQQVRSCDTRIRTNKVLHAEVRIVELRHTESCRIRLRELRKYDNITLTIAKFKHTALEFVWEI
jgi:hypothetical protein